MSAHPFIEAQKRAGHSVKRACELLKVSRAAYYTRRTGTPSPRTVRDAELTEQITDVHTRSRGTYGAPRIHAALQHDGAGCGRRRVARLMRAAGLTGRHRRRRHLTTVPDPRAATRPDLIVRDFRPDPTGPDARWCGDITHIPTDQGRLYLATVIDIASRRVVGWATADHMRTDLVADALPTACRQRRPTRPAIFLTQTAAVSTPASNSPPRQTSSDFARRLVTPGSAGTTALAESFFSTIKRELLDTATRPSRATARTAIFDFIESWYTLHPLHSSLGYLSPADYETALAA